MPDPAVSFELPPGGVMGDSGFYARAADAIRSACALVGEAADAAQRAGFFASLANWADEAEAAAVEADMTAAWAAVSARRARQDAAVFDEAARRTVAEVASAYAAATEDHQVAASDVRRADSGASPEESRVEGTAGSSGSAVDVLMVALAALAEERSSGGTAETAHDPDDGYLALAESLGVLSEARGAYGEVADALNALLEAQEAYRQEVGSDTHAALAADIQADLAAGVQAAHISDVRAALAELRVVRSAYNATMANDVWDLLAEVRIALAEAAMTLREVRAAVDPRGKAQDPYGASAIVAALSEPDETSPDAYDAAMDVVVEVTDDLLRCKAAYEAVEGLLAEVRAVAADALIEARAAVGADALVDARAAYDVVDSALDTLVGSREAFEVGMALAIPDSVRVEG